MIKNDGQRSEERTYKAQAYAQKVGLKDVILS